MNNVYIKEESNKEYHGSGAISRSSLAWLKRTPAYYKWKKENPELVVSPDLVFGAAFHKWVLEQDTFGEEFIVMPNFDKRTKKGKDAYAYFLEVSQGRFVITQDEFDTILAMEKSLMDNELASALLEKGDKEKSIYWQDKLTKIECKCRPDVLRRIKNRAIIVDLKSCRNADTNSVVKDFFKFSYDLQSGMYREGVSVAYEIKKSNIDFIFLFVEKTPPHLVNIVQVSEDVLQHGENLMREYLGTLKECEETNNWYGYNGFLNEPTELNLPNYLKGEPNEEQR